MKKLCLILIFAVSLTIAGYSRDVGMYNVEELTGEGADSAKKPFTITEIEQRNGELRLWIQPQYGGIASIARMVSSGLLEAQVSDSEGSDVVLLSLQKAVVCKDDGTYHLRYSEPDPDCLIERTNYYLRAPVTLRKDRDLGIGLDPDFLWLIEER